MSEAKPKSGYVNWWWVGEPTWGPFVKTTFTTRRFTDKELTAYDRENGWPVGKVYRKFVRMEGPPRKEE